MFTFQLLRRVGLNYPPDINVTRGRDLDKGFCFDRCAGHEKKRPTPSVKDPQSRCDYRKYMCPLVHCPACSHEDAGSLTAAPLNHGRACWQNLNRPSLEGGDIGLRDVIAF